MSDEAADAFLAHVDELSERYGVDLDPSDVEALFADSVQRGFGHAATEEAFAAFLDENFEDADAEDSDGEVFDDDELDHEEDADVPDDQDADDGIDPRLEQDLQYHVERLQEKVGRRLTQGEISAAAEQVRDALARGGGPAEVAAAIEQSGAKSTADMAPSELVEFQVSRLRDGRPSVADSIGDRGLDLDDAQDRQTYMLARLEGAEFDNPDPVEPAGDESGFAGGGWE